jgi:acyl carrier protein
VSGEGGVDERRLARLWASVLGLGDADVKRLTADTSFLDLGGNSVLVAQLVLEIENELGVLVRPAELAGASTLADMASAVRSARARR